MTTEEVYRCLADNAAEVRQEITSRRRTLDMKLQHLSGLNVLLKMWKKRGDVAYVATLEAKVRAAEKELRTLMKT